MPATTSLDHFHDELLLARREALALLRRAMQSNGADAAPTPAQIRAAIAILRLPKHGGACQAGDEPPPNLPSSPPSTPTPEGRCAAHPQVSSSPPSPPRRAAHPQISPSPQTSPLPTAPSLLLSLSTPLPTPTNPTITRLLSAAGAAHSCARHTPPHTGPPPIVAET